MILPHDSGQGAPAAQEGQSEARSISTYKGGDFTARPSPPTRPGFMRRHRRSLRVLGILLLIVLLVTAVRLSATLIPADDQLLVGIGNQGTALIDLRQSLPISPYLLGSNVFPAINTSSVDQNFNGFMSYGSPITSGLQNAQIKLLRFPGGTWGEQHLLSYDQINAFSTLLSQVGAEGMMQVRISGPLGGISGLASLAERANLAGRWVDYVNNPRSSLRTGKYAHAPYHPITRWTVGNEPDLLVNPDTGKLFTVADYVQDFIQFSLAMHQNDPAIQVFGPELSQFYGVGVGPTDPTGRPWMEGFLQGVGAYEKAHPELKFHLLDGVSFHSYPLADAGNVPSFLLSSTNQWDYLLPSLRQLIRQELGRDVPIAVTEINSNPTKKAPVPEIAALWWADTLGTLMEQGVEYVAFFSTEGVDNNYPLFTTDGLHPTPMLRVMQLFSRLQHNLIPVAASRDPVSLYATQDDAHQTVGLLFINKSATPQLAQVSPQDQFFGSSAWHDQNISLAGYSMTLVTLHRGGGAEAYSFVAPTNEDAANQPLKSIQCGHKNDQLDNTIPC